MDLARCARSLPLTITCKEARDNTFDQMVLWTVHTWWMSPPTPMVLYKKHQQIFELSTLYGRRSNTN
jgi:hypothetical protein